MPFTAIGYVEAYACPAPRENGDGERWICKCRRWRIMRVSDGTIHARCEDCRADVSIADVLAGK